MCCLWARALPTWLAPFTLMDLIEKHNEAVGSGEKQGEIFEEPMIAVLEKGSRIGAHQLSGAVLDPKALSELIPDWRARDDFPVERFIERDEMVFLTQNSSFNAPWVPPEMNNHGKPVVSLGKLCAWLGEIAEEKGCDGLSRVRGRGPVVGRRSGHGRAHGRQGRRTGWRPARYPSSLEWTSLHPSPSWVKGPVATSRASSSSAGAWTKAATPWPTRSAARRSSSCQKAASTRALPFTASATLWMPRPSAAGSCTASAATRRAWACWWPSTRPIRTWTATRCCKP